MSQKNNPTSIPEYFDENTENFLKFGEIFIKNITDEELISDLAHKDLEKLTKVWKLVFELLENNSKDPDKKLNGLFKAINDLNKEEHHD